MTIPSRSDNAEVDCPWFDPEFLLDHPDFPLAPGVPMDSATAE